MRHLRTTQEVITALGGTKAVAQLVGVSYRGAHNYLADGSFPSRTLVIILAELKKRGCTAPMSLWRMAEPAA